ncbi:MAG: hypothetical protein ACQKBU_01380, partial [Verrucomicrobiales bacterium]
LGDEELFGANSDWSDFVANDISDSGNFVAGTATKDGVEKPVLLLKVDIVPDYDRDGVIREEAWTDGEGKVHPSDYQRAAAGETFRFWFNNDDDADAVGGPDIPGSVIYTGDSISSKVDGIRDLVDFFPLSINFNGLLDTMDLSKVKVQFTGPGVNWIEFDDAYGGISESAVNLHHRIGTLAQDWSSATTVWGGLASSLSERILERIRDGRGVLLLEGRGTSTEPLMMEFSYDGNLLFKKEVPISLHPVEEMYRHLNLIRALGPQEGPETAMGDPAGLPDAETNGKRFAFVHGYNVNATQSRGWNAEVFKRLYQSGSNAQYVAVYWWGYESQTNTGINGHKTPNYYKNTINAFQSSLSLKSGLAFDGDFTVAAHSLGNMVVSSAIADHGFSPTNFILLNSAVPVEAYDGDVDDTADMRPKSWWGDGPSNQYKPELYASHWHALFSLTDARANLTWGNRFGPLPQAINFYSSGEEVFRDGDGASPSAWDGFWRGDQAWYSQEYNKGSWVLSFVPSDPDIRVHGGWTVNEAYETRNVGQGVLLPIVATEANLLTPEVLRVEPFFHPFEDADPNYPDYDGTVLLAPDEDPAASTEAGKYLTRAKLMAEAIPSKSFAAGANQVSGFGLGNNYDMNTNGNLRNGWPSQRDDQRWLHSDLKNISYNHVEPLFNELIDIGGLDDE